MTYLSPLVKYDFIIPWCPANRLEWYNGIILSAHILGMANNAVSFAGVVTNLNNYESNKINFSTNASTLQIAIFVPSNLFWAKYKYKSLKYGLVKYPVYISFTVTGKCVSLRTFIWIIFNFFIYISLLWLNICTTLPVLIRLGNSCGSWM